MLFKVVLGLATVLALEALECPEDFSGRMKIANCSSSFLTCSFGKGVSNNCGAGLAFDGEACTPFAEVSGCFGTPSLQVRHSEVKCPQDDLLYQFGERETCVVDVILCSGGKVYRGKCPEGFVLAPEISREHCLSAAFIPSCNPISSTTALITSTPHITRASRFTETPGTLPTPEPTVIPFVVSSIRTTASTFPSETTTEASHTTTESTDITTLDSRTESTTPKRKPTPVVGRTTTEAPTTEPTPQTETTADVDTTTELPSTPVSEIPSTPASETPSTPEFETTWSPEVSTISPTPSTEPASTDTTQSSPEPSTESTTDFTAFPTTAEATTVTITTSTGVVSTTTPGEDICARFGNGIFNKQFSFTVKVECVNGTEIGV